MRKWKMRALTGLITVLWILMCPLSAYAINFDFDEVAQSVVVVRCEDYLGTAVGSGFAVAEQYIVTNAHVVESGGFIEIDCYSETAVDNIGATYTAECVASDVFVDIALLYVSEASFRPLEMAESSTVKEGADVYAIGAPENFSYTLTKGTVSSKARYIDGVKYIQTDAGITHGSSGGPLLNEDGQVMGINTSGLSTTESIRFSLHIDEVNAFLDDHLPDGAQTQSTTSGSKTTASKAKTTQPSKTTAAAPTGTEDDGSTDLSGLVIGVVVLVCIVIAVVVGLLCTMGGKKPLEDEAPDETATVLAPGRVAFKASNADGVGTTVLSSRVEVGIRILNGSMAGKSFSISPDRPTTVGKDPHLADVVLDNAYGLVSRLHCTVMYSRQYNTYYVTDCSSNGTYYADGRQLTKNARTAVARGSELKLASDGCRIKLL